MSINISEIILNEERNVRLTAMLQDVGGVYKGISARPAILILPGGGDEYHSEREAEEIAYPFLAAGYQAFVLRYSVAAFRQWPNKLNDYDQAMELIYDKAKEWNIISDKIAVIGFSAGGYLAACAATIARHRPNAVILGYAALEREAISPDQPVPTEYIDKKTPPCFLACARDDCMVSPKNVLNFEMALLQNGISYESHTYAYGGHGFGTGKISSLEQSACGRINRWLSDAVEWLGDVFGTVTMNGMSEPVVSPRMNGDCEEYFNVDCSIAYLRSNGPKEIMNPIFAAIEKAAMEIMGIKEGALDKIPDSRLSDILRLANQSEEEISLIDDMLKQIPNICL